jgi:exopolysaccharide biosynthesis polyprenyl glycosylphosphotransferase
MLYHNVQVMGHSLRVVDAAAIAAASLAVLWLGEPGSAIALLPVAVFCGTMAMYFMVVAERLHIYFARRTEDIGGELFSLCEGLSYAAGLACLTVEILGYGMPGIAYLVAVGASAAALLGSRIAIRVTLRQLRRRGDDYRVWLIVGHNDRAADLAEAVLANPHYGIRIDEVVDVIDRTGVPPLKNARFAREPLSEVKCRILHGTEEVREIVSTRVIDEVVITLPVRSCYDKIRDIVDICSEAGISVKLRPEVLEMPGFYTEVSHVGVIPMVTHYSGPSNYGLLVVKRIVDIIGASVGLLVLSPFLVGVAIAVKMTSPGSLFFVQTRVGLHGRHFQMVKFRSMVRDALQRREEISGLNERDGTAFKIRNDSRITPIGRWMRKYHFDELPQLWNVLVGDMSLVGPRPLPVNEAFGDEWWQRRRLTMPPGLTCLWQLADDPSMPFRQWMELDMAYIDRWSLWLDLKLIALTFATVARGKGW